MSTNQLQNKSLFDSFSGRSGSFLFYFCHISGSLVQEGRHMSIVAKKINHTTIIYFFDKGI